MKSASRGGARAGAPRETGKRRVHRRAGGAGSLVVGSRRAQRVATAEHARSAKEMFQVIGVLLSAAATHDERHHSGSWQLVKRPPGKRRAPACPAFVPPGSSVDAPASADTLSLPAPCSPSRSCCLTFSLVRARPRRRRRVTGPHPRRSSLEVIFGSRRASIVVAAFARRRVGLGSRGLGAAPHEGCWRAKGIGATRRRKGVVCDEEQWKEEDDCGGRCDGSSGGAGWSAPSWQSRADAGLRVR